MKKQFTLLFSIGILNLIIFFGLFKLFQNDQIYQNSIGRVSQNYERTGDWNNYEIKKVSKPYTELKNENLLQWDASIYSCISERMYLAEDECHGKVRAAFFPLFPLIWRLINTTPIGISIINYLIFITSVSLLVIYFLPGSDQRRLIIFSILITLPSTIIYYIPYTESLFLLTMTIAAIGIIKEKYWVYFLGFFLMAMIRPATIFVLTAFFIVETIMFLRIKKISLFFKNSLLYSIPFTLGYFISFLIQYLYSGSWTSFIDAQKYWPGGLQIIKGITDWSVEGFGMNTFSIFFITIPALIFLVHVFANTKSNNLFFSIKTNSFGTDYLFLISTTYLAGIFIFTLLTSGGNLHSFFRFTLTSPFFYLASLILINYSSNFKTKKFVLIFVILSFLLFLFLGLTSYGGNRFQFSFIGLYLLMLSLLYLGIKRTLPKPYHIIAFSIIITANIVWNTYLFNMYLCNGWIFT
jgi:hypothetical protein